MRSQKRTRSFVFFSIAGLGLSTLVAIFLSDGVAAAGPKTDLVIQSGDFNPDRAGEESLQLAPVLSYSNIGGTILNIPKAGFRIADDLELTTPCGCDLTSYSLRVGGIGDGTGVYSVNVSLYDECPDGDGVLIPGTERLFENIPDNENRQLVIDLSTSPVSVPGIVWVRVSFSSNLAGWWTGSEAEVGVTRNKYDHPFTGCNTIISASIFAGFDAEAFCEETSSAPPAPLAPVPANGAVDVVPNTMLTWSAPAGRGNQFAPASAEDYVTYDNTYEALGIVPRTEVIMPNDSLAAVRKAVEAGEIPDPSRKRLPRFAPGASRMASGSNMVSKMTRDDLTLFEDTDGLLDTDFSSGALFNLMADASNEVLAQHGDNFDFIAFFLNFFPFTQLDSAAFYLGLESDVSGIGTGIFNQRGLLGVGGVNIEGWVMMWNQASWTPGGTFTRLVLGQEFEHRFGMFLNPLPGGRPLQGDGGSCGRGSHWNFRTDGQGSGMEIAEWVGSSPAIRQGGTLNFNTDIGTPGVFSFPDLYLMGYVSPTELDTFPSELRYMDNNTSCSSSYNGPISTWTSADLVATNGVRSPNSENAQKHFRTAWVMVHRVGAPPTISEMDRVASILNDWSDVYEFSTLGRGTMDNTTVNFIPPCTTLYDVRFGTVNPPTTLICEDIPDTMCDPGILACNTSYFWQVTSKLGGETAAGPVWSFSAPTGTEDCNSNGVIDACDVAVGTATDCQPDGIPDICQIPPLGPAGADCNSNAVPDACDLVTGVLHDLNTNGVPDECEVSPALVAPAPHDIRKNRFVSFDPNPANSSGAKFRIELLDWACSATGQQCNSDSECKVCVGGNTGAACRSDLDCSGGSCELSGETCEEQSPPVVLGWVGTPTEAGESAPAGTKTAEVVKVEPAARVWTESVVHISDCEIAPVHDYAIRASLDGLSFAQPLIVSTIARPEGKFWGDLVGSFDGVAWSAPNTLVGVDDVLSMLKFLTLKPAPHITVVDLIGSAPTYTNFIINASDLTMVLQGFSSKPYPPVPYVVDGYPADGDVTLCP